MGKIKDRHLDVSAKLIEMGQALMAEGKEGKDFAISQTGSFMILIGGLLFDEKDVYSFGELCSMYSAKKILESMENHVPNMGEFLKEKGDEESYDDMIKRINKIRKDNGHTPLE
jgi:hypothetical protein